MRQSAPSHQQLVVRPCLSFFFQISISRRSSVSCLVMCTVCLCNKPRSESNENWHQFFRWGAASMAPWKSDIISVDIRKKKYHFRLAYNIFRKFVFLFRCPPCAMRINGSDRGRRCGFSLCVY
jgi:hypothetical protein